MRLLLLLVVTALVAQTTFRVESLKPQEIKELSEARAALMVATEHFQATELRIRQAHGQPLPTNTVNAVCFQTSVNVEIRGEYALITTASTNACTTNKGALW